jgi:hypothetical protein
LPNIHIFLQKIDQYTTLEATELFEAGQRFRTIDLMIRPVWILVKLLLYKKGFRDGLEGFMFCALSGLSAAVRTWKLRELEKSDLVLRDAEGRHSDVRPVLELPGLASSFGRQAP